MSRHDSPTTTDHGGLGRLGAFVHRHRGRVVLGWVAALAAILALTPLLRGTYQADFATKGSESERAASLLSGSSLFKATTRASGRGLPW